MILDKDKILELYPGYNSVLGPYVRNDGRKHIVLNDSTRSKSDKTKIKTISYPKALLEVEIERRLIGNETTDHVDEDKHNDIKENLQVLSREENAKKSAIGNKHCLGYKQSEEQRRSSDKNGMSQLSNNQVLNYREKFDSGELSKQDIINETGMCDKSVRNFLYGQTYNDVEIILYPTEPIIKIDTEDNTIQEYKSLNNCAKENNINPSSLKRSMKKENVINGFAYFYKKDVFPG
jgi:hypothetical protein